MFDRHSLSRFIAHFLFIQCSCAIGSSLFVISVRIFELSY